MKEKEISSLFKMKVLLLLMALMFSATVASALKPKTSEGDEDINEALEKDSKVEFVEGIAQDEAAKEHRKLESLTSNELNEFLQDKNDMEEGSGAGREGPEVDTEVDNEEYEYYSSGDLHDEKPIEDTKTKAAVAVKDKPEKSDNNDFHFDDNRLTEDEEDEDEDDYDDEDEEDELLYEYYNDDEDDYYYDDYDEDDNEDDNDDDEEDHNSINNVEENVKEEAKQPVEVEQDHKQPVDSNPEIVIIEEEDIIVSDHSSYLYRMFRMSYLYVMLVSAIISFLLAVMVFFICRRHLASRQHKLVPFVVSDPRSYNHGGKTRPTPSPIVRNYQKVPTSTKDFMNATSSAPAKDSHTLLDMDKPLLT